MGSRLGRLGCFFLAFGTCVATVSAGQKIECVGTTPALGCTVSIHSTSDAQCDNKQAVLVGAAAGDLDGEVAAVVAAGEEETPIGVKRQ